MPTDIFGEDGPIATIPCCGPGNNSSSVLLSLLTNEIGIDQPPQAQTASLSRAWRGCDEADEELVTVRDYITHNMATFFRIEGNIGNLRENLRKKLSSQATYRAGCNIVCECSIALEVIRHREHGSKQGTFTLQLEGCYLTGTVG